MIRKRIEKFITDSYNYTKYIYLRIQEARQFGDYKFPYREDLKGTTCYLLANGPSLKLELEELKNDEAFLSSPKFVVNNFVSSPSYIKLKPGNYCIADPAFYTIGQQNDKVKETLFEIDDKTSWDINLYIPYKGFEEIKRHIHNPKIHLIPVSSLVYQGYDGLKYQSYKKGVASPCFINVSIMIEYVLLNLGCKDIRLYGVDHTFTEGLAVDSENHLCLVDKHFYGENYRRIFDWNGHNLTIAEYLFNKGMTFEEHENMRGYADYLGAQIINCTKRSLIDAYVRESQLKQDKQ